jgi:hypothetical protein
LIGPAAAPAAGFSDEFSTYHPYLPKLFVPHGASVFEIALTALMNLDHVKGRRKTRKR